MASWATKLDRMADWNHYRTCDQCRKIRSFRLTPGNWTKEEVDRINRRAHAQWLKMQRCID